VTRVKSKQKRGEMLAGLLDRLYLEWLSEEPGSAIAERI
jgi:hypothetical protein